MSLKRIKSQTKLFDLKDHNELVLNILSFQLEECMCDVHSSSICFAAYTQSRNKNLCKAVSTIISSH